MSRGSSRREARRTARAIARQIVPGTPVTVVGEDMLAAAIEGLAGYPDDLQQLAKVASVEAAGTLRGLRPNEAGLLLVHPDSRIWPQETLTPGRFLCMALNLDGLRGVAERLRLTFPSTPGWHPTLLVGIDRAICSEVELPATSDATETSS